MTIVANAPITDAGAPGLLPCQETRCSYRRDYLQAGPAALAHDEYHAAQQEHGVLMDRLEAHEDACQDPIHCHTCRELERMSRAYERRLRI